MKAYIYRAGLLCEDCGLGTKKILRTMGYQSQDSNTDPQGPYPDGGGESDAPAHCDHCGVFLQNPLTADGEAYVREQSAVRCRAVWLTSGPPIIAARPG